MARATIQKADCHRNQKRHREPSAPAWKAQLHQERDPGTSNKAVGSEKDPYGPEKATGGKRTKGIPEGRDYGSKWLSEQQSPHDQEQKKTPQ